MMQLFLFITGKIPRTGDCRGLMILHEYWRTQGVIRTRVYPAFPGTRIEVSDGVVIAYSGSNCLWFHLSNQCVICGKVRCCGRNDEMELEVEGWWRVTNIVKLVEQSRWTLQRITDGERFAVITVNVRERENLPAVKTLYSNWGFCNSRQLYHDT